MADLLTRYVKELHEAMGLVALEKLASFRVNRGPMVSTNPKSDFVNRRTRQPYGHKMVEGTQFHVLTHSSTSEKIHAIRESWRFLGLPDNALRIQSD